MTPTIPIVLLTGFLGSGKTTVLNRWLQQRQDMALLINELGKEGIDQHLTAKAGVPVTLMAGGCLCCVLQGSLSTTLRNLYMARQGGQIPAFNRIIIETTGIAEPFGVLGVLQQDRWLAKRFHWQSVVTVVDAVAGSDALAAYPEALEQVTTTNVLLLSKTDVATDQQTHALVDSLRGLNASATVLHSADDQADSRLLDRTFPRHACRIVGAPVLLQQDTPSASPLISPSTHQSGVGPQFQTASLRWTKALPYAVINAALLDLIERAGDPLLRLKGLLRCEGLDGPLMVQHTAKQPLSLSPLGHWPDDDQDSRLVIIGRHNDPDWAQQHTAELERLVNGLIH